MRIGFDNGEYIALQAEHIRERISQFGGKLYLEFQAENCLTSFTPTRVLPGFEPDQSRFAVLKPLIDDVEIMVSY